MEKFLAFVLFAAVLVAIGCGNRTENSHANLKRAVLGNDHNNAGLVDLNSAIRLN
ncbi:MAG: hypothetical protein QOD75_1702 [Blastocatellia bacterium]|nr:hypothetical protein [Blastocatellia bacterium]